MNPTTDGRIHVKRHLDWRDVYRSKQSSQVLNAATLSGLPHQNTGRRRQPVRIRVLVRQLRSATTGLVIIAAAACRFVSYRVLGPIGDTVDKKLGRLNAVFFSPIELF